MNSVGSRQSVVGSPSSVVNCLGLGAWDGTAESAESAEKSKYIFRFLAFLASLRPADGLRAGLAVFLYKIFELETRNQ